MKTLRLSPTSASRRALALELIRRYFREYGSSPSFGEIAAQLGVKAQRVSGIIRDLADAGEILWDKGTARSIRLPETTDQLSDSEVQLLLRRRGWVLLTDDGQRRTLAD